MTAAAVLLASLTVGSTAMATPSKGPATTASPAPPLKGILDGPATKSQDGITLGISADVLVRDFELTYYRWSDSGWHEHPGPVIAVVKSGSVNRVTVPGCKVETFKAGEAFTEFGPHRVFNHSRTTAVLSITQLMPATVDTTDPAQTRLDVPKDPCKGKYRW